ncbi:MAG: hypothetical protein AAGI54_14995, partial [Planctomycetota bacterium]
AAERTPVSAVPPSFSHVEEGRTLGPPSPARASVADRFLRPTVDRPVGSLNATAAVDRFE